MAFNISISVSKWQQEYLVKKGISPSKLFQNVLEKMVQAENPDTIYLSEIELRDKEIENWKNKFQGMIEEAQVLQAKYDLLNARVVK